MLVTTGTDIIVFRGQERAVWESFRTTTRGFVELTAVSHLAVAVPYIIRAAATSAKPAWEGDASRSG